jgi:hypothetical protein
MSSVGYCHDSVIGSVAPCLQQQVFPGDGKNAKRTRCWVCTAVDGDRNRGNGILNNPLNIGQVR